MPIDNIMTRDNIRYPRVGEGATRITQRENRLFSVGSGWYLKYKTWLEQLLTSTLLSKVMKKHARFV